MLAAAGLFFPLTKLLGIAPDSQLSPGLLQKVVHAGAQSASFAQAARDLSVLAEVRVSSQRVRRATEGVGQERVAQSQAAAVAYQELPLPARQQAPGVQVPSVACVQVDGGRIQIRARLEASRPTGYWRETKIGCLQTCHSQVQATDPCPVLPALFTDRAEMAKMDREIHGFTDANATVGESAATSQPPRAQRPVPLVKSVVATRGDLTQFGERLVAAAHARGFAAAPRKAFVADGAAANWSVWKEHFSHYTPILDWIHALMYIHAAALGGWPPELAWATYRRWAQWAWEGEVARVLAELQQRQAELGLPTDDDAEQTPRRVIAEALRYLTNQQERMRYAEYRRAGLPITSSAIESTIKQVNRRIKGSEKFWDQGAEAMLQLVADHLSQTNELANFWKTRHHQISKHRCYQTAA